MRRKFTISMLLIFTCLFVQAQWVQLGQDITGAPFSLSFRAVSMNDEGNIVAFSPGNGNFIAIYELENNQWVQKGNFITSPEPGDNWGSDISLSSDGLTIAIGAEERGGVNNNGAVEVYAFNGSNWEIKGNVMLGNTLERLGGRVDISGDGNTVVAGGPEAEISNKFAAGIVKVFQYDGTTWNQIGQNFTGTMEFDRLGDEVTVNVDGTIFSLGTSHYRDPVSNDVLGLVRVFELVGSNWVQIGDDFIGDDRDSVIAWSISLNDSGNILVVGNGKFYDPALFVHGTVDVYENVAGTWIPLGQRIEGVGIDETFGYDVDINAAGDVIVAGAADFANANMGPGRARVYRFLGDAWHKVDGDIEGDANFQHFGYSVAINASGDRFIACSRNSQIGPGVVKVYGNDNILINETSSLGGVAIYPNPVTDKVSVELPYTVKSLQIGIYDLLGRKLVTKEVSEVSTANIEVNLPSGMYVLKLNTIDAQLAQKITVK